MKKEKKSWKRRALQAGGWTVAKRLSKSIPFAGTAIALGLTGYNIKRKGFVRGVVDSAIDATPVVGTAKNVLEIFTGELIPAKDDSEKKKR